MKKIDGTFNNLFLVNGGIDMNKDELNLNDIIKWKKEKYSRLGVGVEVQYNLINYIEEKSLNSRRLIELSNLGYIWKFEDDNRWYYDFEGDNEWNILKSKTLEEAQKEFINILCAHYEDVVKIHKNLIKDLKKMEEK